MVECLLRDSVGQGDRLLAAVDMHAPTFRTTLYPEYKAQRKQPDADFLAQVPGMMDVLAQHNIQTIGVPGYEADDIIGTLAVRYRFTSDVYIVSGDKDMLQLVQPSVYVLTPHKGLYDHDRVLLEYGLPPVRVADWLALCGDTADNVPGVNGFGPETSRELVQEFGDVEVLINRASYITNKTRRNKVMDNVEVIRLCKKLVTICCNVPLAQEAI